MFSTAHTQSKPRSDGTKTKPGQQQQQKKKKKNPTTIQPPIPNHNTDDTSTNSKKKDRFLSTRVNSSPSPSPSKSARRLRTRERAHAVPFPVLYKTSIATQRVHRGVAGWITATPIDRSLARSEAFALRWPGPAAAAAFFSPPRPGLINTGGMQNPQSNPTAAPCLCPLPVCCPLATQFLYVENHTACGVV